MKQIAALLVLLLAGTVFGTEPNSSKQLSAEEAFLNPEIFQIKVVEDSSNWKRSSGNANGQKRKETDYFLKFSHKASVKLNELRVEYCIYYDRLFCGLPSVNINTGQKAIPAPRAKRSEEVEMYSGRSFKIQKTDFSNELVGGCFRIYMTCPNGKEVMREIRYPSSLPCLTYPWKEHEDPRSIVPNSLEKESTFLDPASFIIRTTIKESKWINDDDIVAGRERKNSLSFIHLTNQTPHRLTGIRMEHCIYRDRKMGEKEYISAGFYSKHIGTLPSSSKSTILTDSFISFRIDSRDILNEVLGMRARVYLPLKGGREAMREICFPDSLSNEKYPWTTTGGKIEPAEHKNQPPPPVFVTAARSSTTYRTFTTVDGEKLSGRPMGFAATTGRIKLEMANGSKRTVELQTLAAKDQEFIQDWHSAFLQLHRNMTRISLKKRKDDGSLRDILKYEFHIENRNKSTLTNLLIEYCVYSQTEVEKTTQSGRIDATSVSYDGPYGSPTISKGGFSATGPLQNHPDRTISKSATGYISIASLPQRGELTETTLSTTLYNGKTETSFFDGEQTKENKDSKLFGIRYRVYLPTPNGNWVRIESAEPESLLEKTKWPSK